MKITIIVLIVVFISCFAVAVEDNDLAMTGFYSSRAEIINKLDNVKAGYKEHFLLGVTYKKNKELKKAILHFTNSCFKYAGNSRLKLFSYPVYKYVTGFHIKSEYYDDAVYEIASLFYEYREFDYVIRFIDLIKKTNSVLYRDAVILKSNAIVELGRYDEAVKLLKELLSAFDNSDSKSIVYIRIASALERNSDYAGAIKEYFSVLDLSASSWQAEIACDRIRGLASDIQYEFTDNENLLLAAALYYKSKISDSLEILKILIQKETDEQLKQKILTYSVMAYVKAGKLGEAESLISGAKDNISSYHTLLKTEADELWSSNRRQPAVIIYQKLKEESTDRIQKESYRKIAQFMFERKGMGYEKLITDYKEKFPEDKALENFLWLLVKNKLAVNDLIAATKYLEESLILFPAGPHSGRTRYWLVKLYQAAGRKDDASQKIMEMAVMNPDSAYTWKKLEHIKDEYRAEDLNSKFDQSVLSKNDVHALFYHALLFIKQKNFSERDDRIKAMEFISAVGKFGQLNDIIKKPELVSGYKYNLNTIEKYFAVGYNEGINREMSSVPDKKEFLQDKNKTLAYLGSKYDNYYYTVTSVIKLLDHYHLLENITLLPADTVRVLFPLAFKGQVEKDCEERKVPREMVYAVMRAESTFNHRAVSSAGAEGIMQLMPPTAKGIAKDMKLKEFDLKDPLTSITFGIVYLSWLNKMFKGDFESMVAGYNAGAGNVKKWQKEIINKDTDYFIEFVPFEETRTYILRTNRLFLQYRTIYGN
jgi:tetratricopeptide (TPR) repeat protein